MNKLPKISILTPCYQSGKFLLQAINSVRNQNYPNYEHIIMDGGSNDNSIEILQNESLKDNRIKWVSKPDLGQSDAMNKAFALAGGDIISYLNADDWYHEDAFRKVVQVFRDKPQVDMVVGKTETLQYNNDDYSLIEIVDPETEYLKILLHFYYRFPTNPVSYFYKRKVQIDTGPFPIRNKNSMDYDFLLKAYMFCDIVKIPDVLGSFIMYEDNKTAMHDAAKTCHKTALKHMLEKNILAIPYYYHHYTYNKMLHSKPKSIKRFSWLMIHKTWATFRYVENATHQLLSYPWRLIKRLRLIK